MNETFFALDNLLCDVNTMKDDGVHEFGYDDWRVWNYLLSIIMEHLVKISIKAGNLELKRGLLKKTVRTPTISRIPTGRYAYTGAFTSTRYHKDCKL
ncbi:hypothetical protein Tco_0374190 [Tanacetum coccineum]